MIVLGNLTAARSEGLHAITVQQHAAGVWGAPKLPFIAYPQDRARRLIPRTSCRVFSPHGGRMARDNTSASGDRRQCRDKSLPGFGVSPIPSRYPQEWGQGVESSKRDAPQTRQSHLRPDPQNRCSRMLPGAWGAVLRECRETSLPRVWGCPPILLCLPPRGGDQGG